MNENAKVIAEARLFIGGQQQVVPHVTLKMAQPIVGERLAKQFRAAAGFEPGEHLVKTLRAPASAFVTMRPGGTFMGEERQSFHVHDDDLPAEALKDCFKPPDQPILVHCIHCGEEYDSWRIVWVPFTAKEMADGHGSPDFTGMWCCPMAGCGGTGFKFDIFPADPDWVDPETGEKLWHDDPPMIEGHESDCECVECEMLRVEEEAEFEREMEEHDRKVASGEIKPPPPPTFDDDVPF
jgi:hypothetical protein